MDNNMTIYTAIFGNYDDLKEPAVITPGWDYVCFTDQPLKSKIWDIRFCMSDNPVLSAREVKLLHFARFDKSIWVDASFLINCDLNEWWQRHSSPMTVICHPLRDCPYDEAEACVNNKRGIAADVMSQIREYGLAGLPPKRGLIQSGILMRETTPEVISFCKLWHNQISLSTRDQLGFAYAHYVNRVANFISWNYLEDKEFLYIPHLNRNRTKYLNRANEITNRTY